jgi:hypothetical protein
MNRDLNRMQSAKERTYHTYGQIIYRWQVLLNRRWHRRAMP